MEFQTLKVSVNNHIAHIELNRPDKANAMDMVMWREIGKAFDWADGEADVRVVVLSGNGKHFTAGIDLMALMGVKEMITTAVSVAVWIWCVVPTCVTPVLTPISASRRSISAWWPMWVRCNACQS